MRGNLGAVGLAALLCLPCLAAIGGGVGILSGAALLGFAQDPVAQAAGVALALVGAVAAAWYMGRRLRLV